MARALVRALKALGALSAAGTAIQAVAMAIERRRYPHPGRLVDVGGYRLHIECAGEGRPVVVLEAGAGGASLDWSACWRSVAGLRVCADTIARA